MDEIKVIMGRLNTARKKLNVTHKELGEILGVSKSSIGSAFSRKSMKISKIKLLANELDISFIWLTTGKGEMFINSPNLVQESDVTYKVQCRKCIDKDIIVEYQNNIISSKDELLLAKDQIIENLKAEIAQLKK